MTHALLPTFDGEGDPGRFADSATRLAIQRMTAAGSQPAELCARLFGGASMYPTGNAGAGGSIGERNIAMTQATLDAARVRVVERDVGGHEGRRIAFDVSSGAVQVKRIPRV